MESGFDVLDVFTFIVFAILIAISAKVSVFTERADRLPSQPLGGC